ncbi:hypothetical protein EV424DRAFT_1349510 [Suillus variegatus]|nr:hypothetical protein EV424DRAFT_1349510 [Suillus variegatus]
MSNLPERPPSPTEKLTVKKVLRVIGTGIVLLSTEAGRKQYFRVGSESASTVPRSLESKQRKTRQSGENIFCFCFWKEPWFSVRGHVMSVIFLILGAWSIQIAYVGRVSRKKGTRGENMRVDNDCNQPKSNELTPAGEYNDDTITQ